jgi:hypothetical protein
MPTKRIKHAMRALRVADPGRRFEDAHERHRIDNHVVRITMIVVGFIIATGGVATFWLPGPQVVIVVAGLAIMASQWRVVARLLDRIEMLGRRWHEQRWQPYPHKARAKVVGTIAFVVVVVLLVWFSSEHGLIPGWVPLLGS